MPAVENPDESDDGNDLDDFILFEMVPQLGEIRIAHRIRHLPGGLREPQRGTFGIVEFRAGLVLPHLSHFASWNGARRCEVRRMRNAILAASRPTHYVHDEGFQAWIGPARLYDDDSQKAGRMPPRDRDRVP